MDELKFTGIIMTISLIGFIIFIPNLLYNINWNEIDKFNLIKNNICIEQGFEYGTDSTCHKFDCTYSGELKNCTKISKQFDNLNELTLKKLRGNSTT